MAPPRHQPVPSKAAAGTTAAGKTAKGKTAKGKAASGKVARRRRARRPSRGWGVMAGVLVLVAGAALGSIAVLGAFDRPMRAALLGTWEMADTLPPVIASRIAFGPDGSFDLSEQRSTPQGVLENRLSGRFATRGGGEIVLDIVEPPGRAGRSIIKAKLIAGTHLSLRFAAGQLVYKRR